MHLCTAKLYSKISKMKHDYYYYIFISNYLNLLNLSKYPLCWKCKIYILTKWNKTIQKYLQERKTKSNFVSILPHWPKSFYGEAKIKSTSLGYCYFSNGIEKNKNIIDSTVIETQVYTDVYRMDEAFLIILSYFKDLFSTYSCSQLLFSLDYRNRQIGMNVT